MTDNDRTRTMSANEVLSEMTKRDRPVWTARNVAEYMGLSRPTATDRLKKLHSRGDLKTIEVGNATAYFPSESAEEGEYLDELIEDRFKRIFEGAFIGVPEKPSVARGTDSESAKASIDEGEEVYVKAKPRPGNDWEITSMFPVDRFDSADEFPLRREGLIIKGEIERKPTVGIRHYDFPGSLEDTAEAIPEVFEPDDNGIFIRNVELIRSTVGDDGGSYSEFEQNLTGSGEGSK